MARCRQEIADIEAQIRDGNPDLQGLCLALADWSAELRVLLAQTKNSRRGGTPAANGTALGEGQAFTE
jgi:hypothetical protein